MVVAGLGSLAGIRRFAFGPHVNPRTDDGKMPVELIGPVDHPGGNGPNGMYALQKELRKRIDEGLDWLSIKSLPVSKGAMPWFWNWNDRRYAMWWDAEGLPFVQGPNMLFTNSASPRIDREECALLDAPNCRAMFCHTEWYRDLIAKHRGPKNKSEIVMWPYPIDPMARRTIAGQIRSLDLRQKRPSPGLLEHLAELYPSHIQIHYGQYKREELFDAARGLGPAPTSPTTTMVHCLPGNFARRLSRRWRSYRHRLSSMARRASWWIACRRAKLV